MGVKTGKRKLTQKMHHSVDSVQFLESYRRVTSSVRKMSLEQQQQEETQSKVTNQYRVEITEFQEDSEESEGKKFGKNADS